MIAVIFEVEPAVGQEGMYLDLAAELQPSLRDIDGFVSIERFQSLSDTGRILSLSFWRDEEAVANWRNLPMHRLAQTQGRAGVFQKYRLRVASVIRDYGLSDRSEAPLDSLHHHEAEGNRQS